MSMFELVVAHHQEDLRWLRRIPRTIHCTVYHKGSLPHAELAPMLERVFPRPRWLPLLNSGCEAHTYLHHIITRYDSLAATTVFCQGRPFDHCPDLLSIVQRLAAAPTPPAFRWLGFAIDADDGQGERLFKSWSKNRDRRGLAVADVWQRLFGEPVPRSFRFYLGAQFLVTARQIRRRSRAFYQRALAIVLEHPDHTHCFERFWDAVFATDGIPAGLREIPPPIYLRPIRRLGLTWEAVARARQLEGGSALDLDIHSELDIS
jgi:hypothetical protein